MRITNIDKAIERIRSEEHCGGGYDPYEEYPDYPANESPDIGVAYIQDGEIVREDFYAPEDAAKYFIQLYYEGKQQITMVYHEEEK